MNLRRLHGHASSTGPSRSFVFVARKMLSVRSFVWSIGGGCLVAALFLECCFALTQSRPNLMTSCSPINGVGQCMRLSGGTTGGEECAIVDSEFGRLPHRMPVLPEASSNLNGGARSNEASTKDFRW
jgi:hypothetical protein